MHLRIALTRDPSDARRARSYVRRASADFDMDTVAMAELLTTELFSNALRHGTGPTFLTASVNGDELRVEVSDTSPGWPLLSRPGPHDTSGRGMLLVAAMSQEWGVESHPSSAGKYVWFTLTAKRASSVADGQWRTA